MTIMNNLFDLIENIPIELKDIIINYKEEMEDLEYINCDHCDLRIDYLYLEELHEQGLLCDFCENVFICDKCINKLENGDNNNEEYDCLNGFFEVCCVCYDKKERKNRGNFINEKRN